MPCSFCKAPKTVAKGLCRNCYYRLKKTGTLEYKRKGKPPRQCSIEGCTAPHVAQGFCEAHYRANRSHGDPVSPFGYGERRKHPLYETWRWQARVKEGRVPAWEDFWQFTQDVGERPSENHQGRRYDERKPWGPDNFHWVLMVGKGADHNTRQRLWRAANPLVAKSYALKANYGITLEQYTQMYDEQRGRCAICGTKGMPYDRVNGRTGTLVVDHCHRSRKIGALLCPNCNKGLGCFQDSTDVLEKAMVYLLTHRR